MIAGNLVEIRLPKIQSRKCLRKYNLWRYSRKCLRKFNFNEMRSLELSAYHLPQPKKCFPSKMFEIFSSVLAYRIFVLLLVVVFFHYVIYCCQYHEPLCNIKKQTVNDSGHFYVWTASLIRLSIIERITASVKRKTDLKLFCYNYPGCVCSVNYWRFIQNKTHFIKHYNDLELFQIT
jgi:hypothetical protein